MSRHREIAPEVLLRRMAELFVYGYVPRPKHRGVAGFADAARLVMAEAGILCELRTPTGMVVVKVKRADAEVRRKTDYLASMYARRRVALEAEAKRGWMVPGLVTKDGEPVWWHEKQPPPPGCVIGMPDPWHMAERERAQHAHEILLQMAREAEQDAQRLAAQIATNQIDFALVGRAEARRAHWNVLSRPSRRK